MNGQLEFDFNTTENSKDWQECIKLLCNKLVLKHELPDNSIYLATNYGKVSKDSETSYSICIYEPEYCTLVNDVRPDF